MDIFFDDKLIKLTTNVEYEEGFKNYLLKSFVLEDILHELKKTSLSERPQCQHTVLQHGAMILHRRNELS